MKQMITRIQYAVVMQIYSGHSLHSLAMDLLTDKPYNKFKLTSSTFTPFLTNTKLFISLYYILTNVYAVYIHIHI